MINAGEAYIHILWNNSLQGLTYIFNCPVAVIEFL